MKSHLAHSFHSSRPGSASRLASPLLALLLLLLLPHGPVAAQSAGATFLVSASATGAGSGQGASVLSPDIPRSAVSADGRFVVFVGGPDLVTNGDGRWGLLMRDTVKGVTTLVSANPPFHDYGVSDDGRFVLFTSPARDLAPGDANDSFDLYLRDLTAGTTTLVSADLTGKATGSRTRLTFDGFFGFEPVMSADGRFVAFASYAPGVTAEDTVCAGGPCDGLNSLSDVFVRDVRAGTTTLVSLNLAGAAGGNTGASEPSISADGRRVAFRSASTDLAANSTTPPFNIYVRDLDANVTTLVSVNRFGTAGGRTPSGPVNAFRPMISADGRFVAFESSATDLVPNKTDFLTHDVFVRDLAAGATTLVSVNVAGTDSPSPRGVPSSRFSSSFLNDISADGRFVAFDSNAPDLAPNDANGFYDVFVRDVAAGLTTLVSAGRAGNASGGGESGNADLSADGQLVAFMSNAGDLVENDNNKLLDVFARTTARPGSVQLAAADFAAAEGQGRALVTVTRAGDASLPATVTLRTVDDPAAVPCDPAALRPDGSPYPRGAAFARCDYATTIETLTWAAGDAQPKTVAVPLTGDAHAEGDETFRVALSDNSGATLGAHPAATVTVRDDDAPGQPNPLRDNAFFVRQHYLDFLSREPEAGEPWTNLLDNCPAGDTRCDRLTVSAAFFGSREFRLKGFYVFVFYRVSFDRLPTYDEIAADMRRLAGATPDEVFARRAQFAASFTGRQEFGWVYRLLTDEQYVDRLLGRYSLQQITTPDPSQPEAGAKVVLTRADLTAALGANALTRAQVLRAVADSDEVGAREFNGAFVAMQYYGYLRRTPEEPGYTNWLKVINANPSDSRTMVSGFLNSTEYGRRFGQT